MHAWQKHVERRASLCSSMVGFIVSVLRPFLAFRDLLSRLLVIIAKFLLALRGNMTIVLIAIALCFA